MVSAVECRSLHRYPPRPRLTETTRTHLTAITPPTGALLFPKSQFAPVEHRKLPSVGPVSRNFVVWPPTGSTDRLALLITQYFCSPPIASTQIPVVHDALHETHPRFFPAITLAQPAPSVLGWSSVLQVNR